ncbi:MAG: winged helix-turn-helix transcriptional regulator [Promethearchaeota archaeon]
MSFLKREIEKYKKLFCIKIGIIITLICISIISIFLLIPPDEDVFGPKDYTFNWFLIGLFSFFTLFLTSFFILLTVNQYRDYFRRKNIITNGRSYLSFDDIFENENRKNIINKILLEPGIHNNELLRQCNLQKGQLQWHLYVLLKYGIIKKEKFGQYISFFPVLTKIELKKIPIKLINKSKTSLKVLDLIEKYPGINSAMLAKKLNLRRSTVKYHVDKLAKLDFITPEKYNREIKLFLSQNDYE